MDGVNLGSNADEHAVMVPIGSTLLLGILYLSIFTRYETLEGQHSNLISLIGMSMLLTIGAFLVLLAFAHYIESLEMVKHSAVATTYILLAGLFSANVPAFYKLFAYRDIPIAVLMCMLMVLFYMRGKILLKGLAGLIPLRDIDVENLFQRYPPVKRSDMILLDFFIVALLVMPFLTKLFH